MASSPPEFLKPAEPALRPRRHWFVWLLVPALALVLLLQIGVADRERLAADPVWRPRIERLCSLLGCELPPWREPSAFHLSSREVRPHPTVAGALLISITFRNDARFAQPWPLLELSLANLEGQPLGLRRFTRASTSARCRPMPRSRPASPPACRWRSSIRENAPSSSISISVKAVKILIAQSLANAVARAPRHG